MTTHLDYGNLNFDEGYSKQFYQRLESIHYPVRDIIGISREKLYQGLGLELLQYERWYRKPCPSDTSLKDGEQITISM